MITTIEVFLRIYRDEFPQVADQETKSLSTTSVLSAGLVDIFRSDAIQGRGARGGLGGDGKRGRLPLPGSRGPDPELRRRQTGRREAGRAPTLEAGADDQGQPGLAADARPPHRPRRGQDDDHGGAAAPRPAPLPGPGTEAALESGDERGGDDQGGAEARPRRRSRRPAGNRLRLE